MKKKLITLLACVFSLALLGGCKNDKISNDYLTIHQYKGLEVESVEAIAVTDEDVEASIKSDLETLATYTDITDRAAKLGDVTTIDFVGKKDGIEFEGGTGTDQELELGSGSFIEGFEEGVVGHKIGETFDLNLTFPSDYHVEDLKGKAVVFTVTLKKIKEKHVPELSNEILTQLGSSATTVEEYRAQMKADLEKSNKESAEKDLLANIWEALVEQCDVKKYPEGKVDEYIANLEETYYYYAYIYGMETSEVIEKIYGIPAEEVAQNQVCQDMAIALIAEKEGLTLADDEYEKGLAELAAKYGYDDASEFESAYGEDDIRASLLQDKVGDFLLKHCVLVEAEEE